MQIKKFKQLPPFVMENITRFKTDVHSSKWEDLYTAICELKKAHPNVVIKQAPFFYVSLEDRTTGLIFLDEQSEELYYVFG